MTAFERNLAALLARVRSILRIKHLHDEVQSQATRRVLGVVRTVVTGATVYGAGGRVLRIHAPYVTTGVTDLRLAVPAGHPATIPEYDELGRTLATVNPDHTILSRSYRVPRVERGCDARHGAAELLDAVAELLGVGELFLDVGCQCQPVRSFANIASSGQSDDR